MKLIEKYFPELTDRQKEQLETLETACKRLNEGVNVVSRKDIENLETNHILHSLAIAKLIRFTPGTTVIDLGTGGGFPGLPLAVLFPDVKFHLVDRVGKKIGVAREIAEACGLKNVSFQHGDMGECHLEADFVVSRAVMPQAQLVKASRKNISKDNRNALPNGIISLKGGELGEELREVRLPSETVGIDNYFDEPFFKTKKIVYTQI